MELTLETLEVAVLRLPLDQRTRLLDRLVASIDGDAQELAQIDAEWDAVADAREAALLDGTAHELSREEVLAELRADLRAAS